MTIIMRLPTFPPYVCIVCGVGDDRRKWYADIQINLDNHFNPVMDGVVYYCNECWESLATDVMKQAQLFLFGVEPWTKDEEYVPPSYNNETELISNEPTDNGQLKQRADNAELVVRSDENSDREPAGDDQSSNGSDAEPVSSEQPVESATDDEPVREFRAHFGKSGS